MAGNEGIAAKQVFHTLRPPFTRCRRSLDEFLLRIKARSEKKSPGRLYKAVSCLFNFNNTFSSSTTQHDASSQVPFSFSFLSLDSFTLKARRARVKKNETYSTTHCPSLCPCMSIKFLLSFHSRIQYTWNKSKEERIDQFFSRASRVSTFSVSVFRPSTRK